MSNVSMYVVMHKDVKVPQKKGYHSLLVGGAVGNSADSAEFRDDTGENISAKNKSYCELTGLYWIWKNDTASDVIGINHYRRFFTDNYVSMNPEKCLDVEKIDALLQQYDVLVSRAATFSSSLKEILTEAPSVKDMKAVQKAIGKCFPEYSEDFKQFMNGNEYYPYNMLVMKKEDYNRYCDWLFTILGQVEQDYGNPYKDAYRARLFGFLSERLLYLWVNHNFRPEKIKQLKVLFTEENIFRSNYHILSAKIRTILFRIHKKAK